MEMERQRPSFSKRSATQSHSWEQLQLQWLHPAISAMLAWAAIPQMFYKIARLIKYCFLNPTLGWLDKNSLCSRPSSLHVSAFRLRIYLWLSSHFLKHTDSHPTPATKFVLRSPLIPKA